jgi:hypothetical protein
MEVSVVVDESSDEDDEPEAASTEPAPFSTVGWEPLEPAIRF